jgi:hypothetical protein
MFFTIVFFLLLLVFLLVGMEDVELMVKLGEVLTFFL